MELQRLGIIPYEDAWKLQLELLEKRAEGLIPDTLLFAEHPPVITLGRKSPEFKSDASQIPKQIAGIPVHLVERGGEATYHGPGQLVLYPIFLLPERMGPKAFLRILENSLIALLKEFGIHAYVIDEKTGVWLKDAMGKERKIASLGIAVRKGVSYHGAALNFSNDLSPFQLIRPCGFSSEVMTNMAEQLGEPHSFDIAAIGDSLAKIIFAEFERAR